VKGIRLIDVLRRIQIDRLASAELTGELEHHLAQVEHGERTAGEFMEEIVRYTREIVDRARTFEYEELYEDDEALGPCPRCGRPVFERSWFYRCEEVPGVAPEDDCTFRIWKDKAGRYIDRETARTLLQKGETGELEGFSYRDGRIYSGVLKLEDLELVLQSVQGSSTERSSDAVEYEVDEQPLAPCPMGCGSEVIETATLFVCRAGNERSEQLAKEKAEQVAALKAQGKKRPRVAAPTGDKPCPFVLPRTVCKREITRDEAETYLRDKKTPLLTEFTSRFGRPFAAILTLKENGRHGFEFQPRGGQQQAAADGAAAPADATASAPPPRRSRKRAKAAETEVAAAVETKPAAATAEPAATAASQTPATPRKRATTRKRAAAKSPRKKATAKSAARKSAGKKAVRRKAATKRPTKG
jgi:DNA topoisomerase-3